MSEQEALIVDNAVSEGGAYEVISKRLLEQGKQLEEKTQQLNRERLEEFGSQELDAIARVRVRTENNCVARDIVQVGDHLLFGYNVFIGLKKETKVSDVFALFTLSEQDGNFELKASDIDNSFLADPRFVSDFDELYRYYKHTKLSQLKFIDGKLLAGFQIGERLEDIRVFRWSVSPDGSSIQYIDNRGERDIALPCAFSFEWQTSSRDDIVQGRYPHINVLDRLFVEVTRGQLSIKVEDNSEAGLVLLTEEVDDQSQSLGDVKLQFAQIGELILLSILPYKETQTRFYIINLLTETVLRCDAIGESCVELPEDHGIIFPGGMYLQTGEYKAFDNETKGLKYRRAFRSPNGEDMLFIFYEPILGLLGLFSYNLIEKSLDNPIYGHGYAKGEDGRIVIFNAEDEPTRIHPMQIWQTPFVSEEFASQIPQNNTFLGRIGNSEVVRGISDIYSICRMIANQQVSLKLYEELNRQSKRLFDAHFWLNDTECSDLAERIKTISQTAELVIDEFEKVESIRKQSKKALFDATQRQADILATIRPDSFETAEAFVEGLKQIRQHRGHLMTIKSLRYMNLEAINGLDEALQKADEKLSGSTVTFLSDDKALNPYHQKIDGFNLDIESVETNKEITHLVEAIEMTAGGLDLLSELMATLQVDDATLRTRIIDAISEVYTKLNQTKAKAQYKQKNLGAEEATAQFGAQFKLLSQSIVNGLGLSTTPDKCDEQLSRLLVQLEELEGQFAGFDQFLADIMSKREEIYESFESHKQQLLDERQRKAQHILSAAVRILESIQKRALKFTEEDALNTYLASDSLVLKSAQLANQLRDLDDSVKADDIEARLKAIKEQAIRSLRDKTDIYEDGGNVIKLGPRHKFSVNTQTLDLTLLPRDDQLMIHLTGTDFYQPLQNQHLLDLKAYWNCSLSSESDSVCRAEYLAYQILRSAEKGEGVSLSELSLAAAEDEEALNNITREFAAPRYKEGYQKGIHDQDAARIVKSVLAIYQSAGLLRFSPTSRMLAQLFWHYKASISYKGLNPRFDTLVNRAKSAKQMHEALNSSDALNLLMAELKECMGEFFSVFPIPDADELTIAQGAEYLILELTSDNLSFITSKYAEELVSYFKQTLSTEVYNNFISVLNKQKDSPSDAYQLVLSWLGALIKEKSLKRFEHFLPEAASLIILTKLHRTLTQVDVQVNVSGLLGEHPRINQQGLEFSLDEFISRLNNHEKVFIPQYQSYQKLKRQVIDDERAKLRLHEFQPRPLSSFVRNRLINESYLPIIGDNLAKQMGTIGDNKRSDLMGLLMMISPPGYGKTTLMEYVANRLGLIFMKINCPSIGHEVTSLDPAQAPNATASAELVKLNLALEMGNNVMLYLDDIQHTHSEFLQKFISLCDGTRRVDGIWRGQSKTYDMRGKKFCVVMAGNPYTETGEAFKVPDMLANRADIYNLGDILGGMEEVFSLSYIENSLTSNSVLAPLALRDMQDVYTLVDMAKGKPVPATDLSHAYSSSEINEITSIIKKLFVVQDVILKINQQYIASAAQDDKYRTEPSFKLQGSYRNMNKMTEKVSSVMNDDELIQLVDDHYLGESQLLTTGSEANLLKLAELRGILTSDEKSRWEQIKKDFLRNKALGGDEADTGNKIVAQLADLVEQVQLLTAQTETEGVEVQLANLVKGVQAMANASMTELNAEENTLHLDEASMDAITSLIQPQPAQVEVINQPMPGVDQVLRAVADTLENTIAPMIKMLDRKIDIDLRNHDRLKNIASRLREFELMKAEALDAQSDGVE